MIGDCFNCKHNMYVGEGDSAEDFLGCGGEGWEEE